MFSWYFWHEQLLCEILEIMQEGSVLKTFPVLLRRLRALDKHVHVRILIQNKPPNLL